MVLHGKLFSFAIRAIILLMVISGLWPFAAPIYDRFLVGISDQISSSEITLVGENRIRLTKVGGKSWGIDSLGFHFGFILIMVLAAATPGLKLWPRFKFMGLVLALVFVIQAATLVMLAGRRYIATESLVIFLLPIGCSLFPVVVWGALSFKNSIAFIKAKGSDAIHTQELIL